MPVAFSGPSVSAIHRRFAPTLQPTSSTLCACVRARTRCQNGPRPSPAARLRSTYASPNSPLHSASSRFASSDMRDLQLPRDSPHMRRQPARGEEVLERGPVLVPFLDEDSPQERARRELVLAGENLLADELGVELARRVHLEQLEAGALEQAAQRGGMKVVE